MGTDCGSVVDPSSNENTPYWIVVTGNVRFNGTDDLRKHTLIFDFSPVYFISTLQEYGITDGEDYSSGTTVADSMNHSRDGVDPPSVSSDRIEWPTA